MDRLPKLASWLFVGVVGATVLAAIIGATLEPTHVATRQAVYARTPEEVWTAITRFDRSPQWRTDVDAVQIESGDPIRFVEMGPHGAVPFEVTEQERPHKLVLLAADPNVPVAGSWTLELAPTPSGTQLTVTEHGSIDNPLYRLVSRVFIDPGAATTTYLVDLGHHFEEEVTPVAPP